MTIVGFIWQFIFSQGFQKLFDVTDWGIGNLWNNFLLTLLMLNGSPNTKTLILAAYNFVGQLNTKWHYALAAMTLGILPSIFFYVFL